MPIDNSLSKNEYKKRWRMINRDQIIEKKKVYYNNNKNNILIKQKMKFMCICKGCYRRRHKAHHFKTKKHINYMKKHDDIMQQVNDVLEYIKDFKII